jgi:hypothetical protein
MLWVWVMIVGSIALAAYLWMRIDEARKPQPRAPNAAVLRKTKQ